jgi:glutamate synthase domain-containing protein 3
VLDGEGGFTGRCNTQLVGLEELDSGDDAVVLGLVREHAERTGSAVAARLLADWSAARFVKVIPHDFKRALAELGDEIHYHDHPVSAGGVGFVTKESEEAA